MTDEEQIPLPPALVERIAALTEGVEVDLNAPLDGDVDLPTPCSLVNGAESRFLGYMRKWMTDPEIRALLGKPLDSPDDQG